MKNGIVFSAFDLLHCGHILMLKEAKDQCDYLICGLQTDPTIDRPNTKNKPIQSIFERYIQLSAVKYVNEIIVYQTEKDILDILKSIPIHIRIIGAEYNEGKKTQFTGKNVCEELGIEIYYNERNHNFSTTELRQRIRDEHFS